MNEKELQNLIKDSAMQPIVYDGVEMPDMTERIKSITDSIHSKTPNKNFRREKMENNQNVATAIRKPWYMRIAAITTACVMLVAGLGVGAYFLFRPNILANGTYRISSGVGFSVLPNTTSASMTGTTSSNNVAMSVSVSDPLSEHFSKEFLSGITFSDNNTNITVREYVDRIINVEIKNYGSLDAMIDNTISSCFSYKVADDIVTLLIEQHPELELDTRIIDRNDLGFSRADSLARTFISDRIQQRIWGYIWSINDDLTWNSKTPTAPVTNIRDIKLDNTLIKWIMHALIMGLASSDPDNDTFCRDADIIAIQATISTYFNSKNIETYLNEVFEWFIQFSITYIGHDAINLQDMTNEEMYKLYLLYVDIIPKAETSFVVNGNEITITTRRRFQTIEESAAGLFGRYEMRSTTYNFSLKKRYLSQFSETEIKRPDSAIEFYRIELSGYTGGNVRDEEFGSVGFPLSGLVVVDGQIMYSLPLPDSFQMVWSRNALGIQSLSAPTDITIAGTIISWDLVLGAVNYDIYVNGQKLDSVTSLKYDLSNLTLNIGTHSIQIRAIRETIESPLSSAVEFTVKSNF